MVEENPCNQKHAAGSALLRLLPILFIQNKTNRSKKEIAPIVFPVFIGLHVCFKMDVKQAG